MCLPHSPKFEPKPFNIITQPIEKENKKKNKRVSFSIDEGYKSENSNNSSITSKTSNTLTTLTKIDKTIVENNYNYNKPNKPNKPTKQNETNGNINDMFSSSVFLLNNYKHNLDIAIAKIDALQLQLIDSQSREQILNEKLNYYLQSKYDRYDNHNKHNKVLHVNHNTMISTQV